MFLDAWVVAAGRMIVSGPSSPVILNRSSPSQQLKCVARSYPCQSIIEWSRRDIQLSAVNYDSVGTDGANIFTSVVTVSECQGHGEYMCKLLECECDEKRNVTVLGKQ